MKSDIKKFVQSCIHCLVSKNKARIPRPLASALHDERPNEVIHADFIYIDPVERSNLNYVHIINDDLISHTWLCPSDHAECAGPTPVMLKSITCFDNIDWLVTN